MLVSPAGSDSSLTESRVESRGPKGTQPRSQQDPLEGAYVAGGDWRSPTSSWRGEARQLAQENAYERLQDGPAQTSEKKEISTVLSSPFSKDLSSLLQVAVDYAISPSLNDACLFGAFFF